MILKETLPKQLFKLILNGIDSWVTIPKSIVLPSITSTCVGLHLSVIGNLYFLIKSKSMKEAIAPKSIRALASISFPF